MFASIFLIFGFFNWTFTSAGERHFYTLSFLDMIFLSSCCCGRFHFEKEESKVKPISNVTKSLFLFTPRMFKQNAFSLQMLRNCREAKSFGHVKNNFHRLVIQNFDLEISTYLISVN